MQQVENGRNYFIRDLEQMNITPSMVKLPYTQTYSWVNINWLLNKMAKCYTQKLSILIMVDRLQLFICKEQVVIVRKVQPLVLLISILIITIIIRVSECCWMPREPLFNYIMAVASYLFKTDINYVCLDVYNVSELIHTIVNGHICGFTRTDYPHYQLISIFFLSTCIKAMEWVDMYMC